jgi:hypothetical protein
MISISNIKILMNFRLLAFWQAKCTFGNLKKHVITRTNQVLIGVTSTKS